MIASADEKMAPVLLGMVENRDAQYFLPKYIRHHSMAVLAMFHNFFLIVA